MNEPFISGITLAYGNRERLQEAIACFLEQDYSYRELVVLNTAPQQILSGNFHCVRLINLSQRPKSIGACRNLAIQHARGDFILIFDSDDHFLPGHFRRYAEALVKHPNAQWIRFAPTFFAEKWKIKHLFNGWANSVGYTKEAWLKVGGYSSTLSVGEDRQFIGRLSSQCPGNTLLLKPEEITAIYNWDTGTYHISGMGEDKKGRLPAYERSRIDFERRMRIGQEPKGVVHLQPAIEHDPAKMVSDYLQRPDPTIPHDAVVMVYIGRFGDITNVLPIAQHIHNQYGTPHFMVGREFASLLDGVSYVKPYVVPFAAEQINEALALANRTFRHVINCQIWGKGYNLFRQSRSYNEEAWRVAGFEREFSNFDWSPVFDRRDRKEEEALCLNYNPEDKRMLLVNVTKGNSSPFTYGPQLLAHLREKWSDYLILDASTIRAKHVYDLLGLIDYAWAAISIDTSLLHLAAACRTPTLALVNPTPWQGTIPRFGHCEVLPYSAVTPNDFSAFDAALLRVLSTPKPPNIRPTRVVEAPKRRVFHALERHTDEIHELRRKEMAVRSWETLYANGVVPCHYRQYKRTADKTIGDVRALPYLKDVLEFAMQHADPQDIVMWTNDDNILHPEVAAAVTLHCALWGAVSSHRCEFKGPVPPMTLPPEEIAKRGGNHMGRDIFAFTKEWLENNWNEIPDFILGASDFDLCLACMVRLRWGIRSNRQNMEQTMWPAELHRGYVSHRFHPPKWNAPNIRDAAPSQLYNRKLFREWAQIHLPELHFHPNNTI